MKKKLKKHKMHIFWIVMVVLGGLFLAWMAIGYFGSRVEKLSYTVLSSNGEYEIRQLPEHIIAETVVSGDFDDARGEAFSILANYIFGGNKPQTSISMTSPVLEKESEKISMTAPVFEKELDVGEKAMSFVMPSKYTLENLPEPLDERITIKKIEAKKIAVLTFSGFNSEQKIKEKKELLKSYLIRDGISYSTISWAGYNPPWTPPFMRRFEVWAELE